MEELSFKNIVISDHVPANATSIKQDAYMRMVKTVVEACPSDVDIAPSETRTVISLGGKSIVVCAYMFKVNNWNGTPFDEYAGPENLNAVAYDIKFYDNGNEVSMSRYTDQSYAAVFSDQETNKAMFMLRTRVYKLAQAAASLCKDFFAENSNVVDAIIAALPSESDVLNSTPTSLTAEVPVRDYIVKVSFRNGNFEAVIPHKYTETDRVYGKRFRDYRVSTTFNSVEEVESYDWDDLWTDLYENRYGTLTYSGSLGT